MNWKDIDFDDIETFEGLTNEEHAIHHKKTLDKFKANVEEHDAIWEVIGKLEMRIEELEKQLDF